MLLCVLANIQNNDVSLGGTGTPSPRLLSARRAALGIQVHACLPPPPAWFVISLCLVRVSQTLKVFLRIRTIAIIVMVLQLYRRCSNTLVALF